MYSRTVNIELKEMMNFDLKKRKLNLKKFACRILKEE
jgi:hypothetical protein